MSDYNPLDPKTVKNPKAVEKLFCIPFGKLPHVAMDKDMTEMMMNLMMISNKVKKQSFPEHDKPFIFKMLDVSLNTRFSFTIEDETLRFFIAILANRAGTVIMYLTYLQYVCFRDKVRNLKWDKFCAVFEMGFPNEVDLQKAWDGQKVKRKETGSSDNLLDYQSAMKSIHFEPETETA